MKVCFETFGCRLNKAEALQMEADYLARGWEVTERHSDADLIVVRGCSVTARAQHDCEKTIDHLKRHYPLVPIHVCGCLKQKDESESPSPVQKPAQPAAPGPHDALPVRTARAYLKVQDGCNGKCTFCIVPKFRGSSSSTPFAEVMDRARRFIDAGYREIVVTGCNLSLYASEGKRLPDLVAALASLTPSVQEGGTRIRLGSVEPGACALECAAAMSEGVNVCRFLHIPVQSGSNRILRAMRRPYLVRDVDALVQTARKLMPDISLGCDMMTGFPDELDLDFTATKGLVARHHFSMVHIFPFSERPGTLAASYGGTIPPDIRMERAHELREVAADCRYAYARKFFGKVVEIVVESETKCVGRTSEYLPCTAKGTAPRKSVAPVFVTKVHHDGSLEGIIRPAASRLAT